MDRLYTENAFKLSDQNTTNIHVTSKSHSWPTCYSSSQLNTSKIKLYIIFQHIFMNCPFLVDCATCVHSDSMLRLHRQTRLSLLPWSRITFTEAHMLFIFCVCFTLFCHLTFLENDSHMKLL